MTDIPRFPEALHAWSLHYLWWSGVIRLLRTLSKLGPQASTEKRHWNSLPEELSRTRVVIPSRDAGGNTRMILADRYEKKGTTEEERKKKGVHLNFHGSGFVFPSLGSDTAFCSALALKVASTYTVYDMDYRKAPENPFPAALNDALDTVAYFLDPSRSNGSLSLSGFSAGANLAYVLAITLPVGLVKNLIAFYGNANMTVDYPVPLPSSEMGPGMGLSTGLRKLFYNCYILPGQSRDDPRLSPIFAKVERWPKHVWVSCGDVDALWKSGELLVEKLKEGGIDAKFVSFSRGGHAFDKILGRTDPVGVQKKVNELYGEAADRLVCFG